MSIRFAAAVRRPAPIRLLTGARARAAVAPAANDNFAPVQNETVLHAALKQFAQHGIGAAAHARNQAERAFFVGDRDTYNWWLDVCRTLDRRLAENLARSSER